MLSVENPCHHSRRHGETDVKPVMMNDDDDDADQSVIQDIYNKYNYKFM
jgi:hypothetical protein